ncbi:substrate-binding periplasmic protein [Aestuariibacter salexigens]|uniref:substrate-binding periplasmic protein n=1 Tax=Aestuariibacter salexigens TaxID=226010 RepID=UPI0004036BED|nr:transporter substrate-binding domain-containing protein [Aestuariibacter salexigens]
MLLFTHLVRASDTISIVYSDAYKPFVWEQDGKAVGLQVDFVDEILSAQLGLRVKHVTCPWKRCQLLVEEGDMDGFFTVVTPERERYTERTSIPFYTTDMVIHTANNNPYLQDILGISTKADLDTFAKKLALVFMRGSGWHIANFQHWRNATQVTEAWRIPEMLTELRADIYVEQAEIVRYQAQQLGLSEQLVTLTSPVIEQVQWHLFISQHSPHQNILSRVDARLLELTESGELDRIKQRIFSKYGLLQNQAD